VSLDTVKAEFPAKFSPWIQQVMKARSSQGVVIGNRLVPVVWINLVTLGAVGALKMQFMADFLNSILHDYPSTSAAVIIHTNRATDDKDVMGDAMDTDDKLEKEECDDDDADDEAKDGPGVNRFGARGIAAGTKRLGSKSGIRNSRVKLEDLLSSANKSHQCV
jgi:hypothetical protein